MSFAPFITASQASRGEVTTLGRFLLVGITNTLIDLFFFNLLLKLEVNVYAAASISFLMAVVNSFILNRQWTFSHVRYGKTVTLQFGQFLTTNTIGLGLNNAIVYIFTRFSPLANAVLTYNVAKLVAIGCVVIWNYATSRFFVFKDSWHSPHL